MLSIDFPHRLRYFLSPSPCFYKHTTSFKSSSSCISFLLRRGPGRRRRRRSHRLPQCPRHRHLANPFIKQLHRHLLPGKLKIRTMEFTLILASIVTSFAGILSFVLGVASEINKLPPLKPEQLSNGKFKCIYPDDNHAYYGYSALALIVISTLVGSLHKYHSSQGIKAPIDAYRHNYLLKFFFFWTMFMEGLAFYMIFQPLYTVHQLRNQTYDHPIAKCPTTDRGVLAGGALSSFGASLLWIVVFILAMNCREDFIRGSDGNSSVGSYGLIEEDLDNW